MGVFDKISPILLKWKHLGFRETQSGAMLIGHVPHIAKEAYLHQIFLPLNMEQVRELEIKLNINIPATYKDFLLECNGLKIFSDALSLDGCRSSNIRVGDAARQPYDIMVPNIDERPKGIPKDWFLIGGYGWDGSLLVITPQTNEVKRIDRDSSEIKNEWPSFEDMIVSEVNRLNELFNELGYKKNSDFPTTPTN